MCLSSRNRLLRSRRATESGDPIAVGVELTIIIIRHHYFSRHVPSAPRHCRRRGGKRQAAGFDWLRSVQVNIISFHLFLPEPAMTDTGQGLAPKGADEVGGAQEDNTTWLP